MTAQPVYLDYAATTPLDARVAARMAQVRERHFANPSSDHALGWQAAAVVSEATGQLAALLGVEADCLVYTSGATESNNLAIVGAARQHAHRGRHLVSMRTEHKAVVDVLVALERQGFEVTWLAPSADGRVSIEDLTSAIRDDTTLVSIMHINNETGVEQDLHAIGDVCRERGVLYHVDAAQSVGKVALDVSAMPVDLLSLTAHKFYGPKGIGALYVAPGVAIEPQLRGGGQQRRLRPGTLPVELIAGLGEAAAIAGESIGDEVMRLRTLQRRLWDGLKDISGIVFNGDIDRGYPGILNVSIADIKGESLLLALEPVCVATGSACNSLDREPSYVLRALGRSDREAQSGIRFSLGRDTTNEQIDFAITRYRNAVDKLRHLAVGP